MADQGLELALEPPLTLRWDTACKAEIGCWLVNFVDGTGFKSHQLTALPGSQFDQILGAYAIIDMFLKVTYFKHLLHGA